jgi:hypothetical protein
VGRTRGGRRKRNFGETDIDGEAWLLDDHVQWQHWKEEEEVCI